MNVSDPDGTAIVVFEPCETLLTHSWSIVRLASIAVVVGLMRVNVMISCPPEVNTPLSRVILET